MEWCVRQYDMINNSPDIDSISTFQNTIVKVIKEIFVAQDLNENDKLGAKCIDQNQDISYLCQLNFVNKSFKHADLSSFLFCPYCGEHVKNSNVSHLNRCTSKMTRSNLDSIHSISSLSPSELTPCNKIF